MNRIFDNNTSDFRQDDEDDSKDMQQLATASPGSKLNEAAVAAGAELSISRNNANVSTSLAGAGAGADTTLDTTMNATFAGLSSGAERGDRLLKRKTRAFEEMTLVVCGSRKVTKLCLQSPELMSLILSELKSMSYLSQYSRQDGPLALWLNI